MIELAILRKVVDFVRAQKIFVKLFVKKAWDDNNVAKILKMANLSGG